MDAPQRSTSWPGVSTCYSHGSQSARNAQPALPRNPFSRPPDVLGVMAETQNIKEYHSFQMSCYTLSPTVKAVSGSAAPNINSQCDAMPSPPSRLLSVLPTILAMADNAKRGLRTASTNVTSVKHYTCDKIGIWWLSSRGFRLRLLRLVASLFAILMSVTLIQSSRTKSPQAYTLVHMCRSCLIMNGDLTSTAIRLFGKLFSSQEKALVESRQSMVQHELESIWNLGRITCSYGTWLESVGILGRSDEDKVWPEEMRLRENYLVSQGDRDGRLKNAPPEDTWFTVGANV
ncbi:hypothetical protein LX32DRAFT_655033 [Colletotrichum zoysiae]|uniref:Uncharacterized protein n=1 Tax=Colletotrichum zoysiae TaxID=1216348 RepID=A0AAD9HCS3_9PEZI|nr:hypothetical protein LX32DRAFT_655033 [Colletotrichum zoysiae]